ncbi:FdtA/QdtA family cupin domain-containing protein [Fibrella sp. HMF5335]|uniref:FdtA/QdtA family cupin domain-containing protein n=1 Tax=Fibrella rubiginis TaxID=2817060 RepID=A0A939JZM7_9BACT|nr:FdtA/QdtA family cupin domain-containing protein [Fibrella rubiginis]MBO0935212.1 FdtA/QdtA family cupin domain-containing protein [Fibrella rubiginis]
MANLLKLTTHTASAGNLTLYDNVLPGDIKRVFYIHGAGTEPRGGHRHHTAWHALICVAGHCRLTISNGSEEQIIRLQHPDECLVLEPQDWRVMDQFSPDAVLLVVSNTVYDPADYIYEPYPAFPETAKLALA